jgi:hypothetical protein
LAIPGCSGGAEKLTSKEIIDFANEGIFVITEVSSGVAA